MAKNDVMNVRQKLAKARLDFLDSKVQKSGKHMKLEFKYFELEDIVPTAIRIFNEVGLVSSTNFDESKATMTIYNTEDMNDQGIVFTAPFRETEQIISKAGNAVTNPLQALGSSITYLRRYLWMMALDITEPDSIDPNIDVPEETVVPEKPKMPATPAERAEVKKELTSADGNANETQIADLKTLCKQLLEKDDSQEDFIQTIALKTEGFTNITESACKELCANLLNMLAEYGN